MKICFEIKPLSDGKKSFLIVLGFIYGVCSFFALIFGLMGRVDSSCHENKNRLQYAFPAWDLGCWLAQKPEEKNNE